MGDDAFSITSVPSPDNYTGKNLFAAAGWTAGVYSASDHKEAARLFTAFLAGKASFLSDKAGIPETGATPPADPFYSKLWDITISGEIAQDFYGLSGEHELEEIFREELLALFEGKSSPADAASAIQKRWTTVLDANK
jgi:ABC-type glycerol-3-phosphate transport system substrate-binding protein